MIYGNSQHASQYFGLSPRLDRAIVYLQSHDLAAMEPGRYPIFGDDVWVKISDITTKPESEALYEAHDNFIDIQMVLHGKEIIRCAFRRDMEGILAAPPDRDVIFYRGRGLPFSLTDGDFLILFPDDVHAPALSDQAPAPVRKALFKVRV